MLPNLAENGMASRDLQYSSSCSLPGAEPELPYGRNRTASRSRTPQNLAMPADVDEPVLVNGTGMPRPALRDLRERHHFNVLEGSDLHEPSKV